MNLAFGLKQELVQTDLSDFAEIVFDFSDMVEEIYDFDDSVRAKQMAIGPWFSAKIMLESLTVKTECSNPIAISDAQKYTNTLLALREGSLKSEYQSITLYREDAQSEKRVDKINTAFPIMISVWIILVAVCLWKIRQFSNSLKETKVQIENERAILTRSQEDVLRLRKLKLMRNQMLEQERQEREERQLHAEDEDYNALAGLVGENDI